MGKLIKGKDTKFSLYYVRPAFNLALENHNKLNFRDDLDNIGKNNLLNLYIFNFKINASNLTKYFELFINNTTINIEKQITERILNSDFLIIDYKYSKISFNYTIRDQTEKRFLSSLFKEGLLNLSKY